LKRFSVATLARSTAIALFFGAASILMSAHAAQADDLQLGGNYNTITGDLTAGSELSGTGQSTVGGGSITTSYLNGVQLPWVYCVDYDTTVTVPGDYNGTVVSKDGTIHHFGGAGGPGAGLAVNNAGQVAWLLDNLAAGTVGNTNAESGLQAAIWATIYNGTNGVGTYVLDATANNAIIVADYNADLTALGTNTSALATIDWLSPSTNNGGIYQGLVTVAVPEPTFYAMAGLLGMGGIGLLRRRKARA